MTFTNGTVEPSVEQLQKQTVEINSNFEIYTHVLCRATLNTHTHTEQPLSLKNINRDYLEFLDKN